MVWANSLVVLAEGGAQVDGALVAGSAHAQQRGLRQVQHAIAGPARLLGRAQRRQLPHRVRSRACYGVRVLLQLLRCEYWNIHPFTVETFQDYELLQLSPSVASIPPTSLPSLA